MSASSVAIFAADGGMWWIAMLSRHSFDQAMVVARSGTCVTRGPAKGSRS